MKFSVRKNGTFTLEDIKGSKDIKFSNLAGAHTNSRYDDPNKDPQRAITIWFDEDDIAKGLKENNFLVGRAVDNYHKDKSGNPLGERYFIKFVAYIDMMRDDKGVSHGKRLYRRFNRHTGKEEVSPKIVVKTDEKTEILEPDEFYTVDVAHIDTMDIRFRGFEYDSHKPFVAAINELWWKPDVSAGGRNDFEDDALEQKWANVPLSDEE